MMRFTKMIKRTDALVLKYREILFVMVISILFFKYVLYLGYVPSQSMEDTIPAGSLIVANRIITDVERGDIVVFEYEDRKLVKRVIGLPGDKLTFKKRSLYINGRRYEEKSIKELPEYEKYHYRVPPDHLFLLGDNRNDSVDSRVFGAIKEDKIIAKNVFLLVSLQSWIQ